MSPPGRPQAKRTKKTMASLWSRSAARSGRTTTSAPTEPVRSACGVVYNLRDLVSLIAAGASVRSRPRGTGGRGRPREGRSRSGCCPGRIKPGDLEAGAAQGRRRATAPSSWPSETGCAAIVSDSTGVDPRETGWPPARAEDGRQGPSSGSVELLGRIHQPTSSGRATWYVPKTRLNGFSLAT